MSKVAIVGAGPSGFYAAEDADVALRLVSPLEQKLREHALDTLFSTLEVPLIETLVDGRFRDHSLEANARQIGDQRIVDPGNEIIGLGSAREVFERKNRKRTDHVTASAKTTLQQ